MYVRVPGCEMGRMPSQFPQKNRRQPARMEAGFFGEIWLSSCPEFSVLFA
jgi:hypothetical protein